MKVTPIISSPHARQNLRPERHIHRPIPLIERRLLGPMPLALLDHAVRAAPPDLDRSCPMKRLGEQRQRHWVLRAFVQTLHPLRRVYCHGARKTLADHNYLAPDLFRDPDPAIERAQQAEATDSAGGDQRSRIGHDNRQGLAQGASSSESSSAS